MKKIFSLFVALMAVMAINATDYYIVGSGSQGWSQNKAENKFVADANGVLTVTVDQLYGEVKVTEDGNWHPQWGKTGDANLVLGTPYTLTKCDDSQGEGEAVDLPVELPEGMRYKNAKFTLDASNPNAIVLTLVEGELYDPSQAPTVYCLVGGCTNNWDTSAAVEFAEENGVLTAHVSSLNGTFKIIKNHEWGWEAGAPSDDAKIAFNQDFALVTSGGKNIGFANPFEGYSDAVVTLDVTNADAPVVKIIGGTFAAPVADWYIAGSKTGWSCGDDQKMTKIDDTHYEFLAAEFEKDFKVVFGDWLVEYGAAKGSEEKWAINTPMILSTPCDNLYPVDETVYIDVTITITVNYETAEVSILLADENYTAVENVEAAQEATKRLIDGQLVIEKNGVRYNVLGAQL